MDMCRRIDHEVASTFRRGLPPSWRASPALGRFESPVEIIRVLRSRSAASGDVTRALLDDGGPEAGLLLLAASIAYVKAWAKGNREYESEALTEVSIVVGEVRQLDELPLGRHLLTMVVDLACDRHRKRLWRDRPPVPLSGQHPIWELPDDVTGPEELAIGRLALVDVQQELFRRPYTVDGAVDSWNTVVRLLRQECRTQEDRNRLNHHRRKLRHIVDPRHVA
jgi:hypothetical protein